jgi:hypothetical protein
VGGGIPADRRQVLVGVGVVGIGHEPAPVGPSRGDIHFVDLPDVGGHGIRGPIRGSSFRPEAITRLDDALRFVLGL